MPVMARLTTACLLCASVQGARRVTSSEQDALGLEAESLATALVRFVSIQPPMQFSVAMGSDRCPAPLIRVNNPTRCKSIADMLQKPFGGEVCDSIGSPGCFIVNVNTISFQKSDCPVATTPANYGALCGVAGDEPQAGAKTQQANYAIVENSRNCPGTHERVEDLDECEAVAGGLGKPFGGDGCFSLGTPGCFTVSQQSVYFQRQGCPSYPTPKHFGLLCKESGGGSAGPKSTDNFASPQTSPITGRTYQLVPAETLRVVALTNQLRRQGHTCPGGQRFPPQPASKDLKLDCRLWWAALLHGEDMGKRRYYSHDSPEGKNFYDRAQEAWGMQATGENIWGDIFGGSTADEAVRQWLGSASHCPVMFEPRNALIGPAKATCHGRCQMQHYWVELFGWDVTEQMNGLDMSCYPNGALLEVEDGLSDLAANQTQ